MASDSKGEGWGVLTSIAAAELDTELSIGAQNVTDW